MHVIANPDLITGSNLTYELRLPRRKLLAMTILMPNHKKAIIALILANTIWGATPPLMKWALYDVHTFTLAFLRYAIPCVLIAIFYHKKLAIHMKDFFVIFLCAFFGITLNIGFYFIGIHYTQSINVTIIASASPVFLILGSIFFLREHLTRKQLLGNLLGLTGVFFIVIQPLWNAIPDGSIFGNILLVLSAFASIGNTLFAKRIIKKYHPMTLVFWTFLVGAISFTPLFFQETKAYGFLSHLSLPGFIGILYGSIFASLIAWFLFYFALKYFKASETGVFEYIDPLATLLVAAPLLHEYPSPLFIFGSLLVFFGIYIAQGRLQWHPIHRLFK